jgi:hypothetical protein
MGVYGNHEGILEATRKALTSTADFYDQRCDICHCIAVFDNIPKEKADAIVENALSELRKDMYRYNFHIGYLWKRERERTTDDTFYYHITVFSKIKTTQKGEIVLRYLDDKMSSKTGDGFIKIHNFNRHYSGDEYESKIYYESTNIENCFHWLSYISQCDSFEQHGMNEGYGYCQVFLKKKARYEHIHFMPKRPPELKFFSMGIPKDSKLQTEFPLPKW